MYVCNEKLLIKQNVDSLISNSAMLLIAGTENFATMFSLRVERRLRIGILTDYKHTKCLELAPFPEIRVEDFQNYDFLVEFNLWWKKTVWR